MSFWEIFLWSLYVFFLFAWLILLFRIFADLFSDKRASGWAKVGWTLFLIFFTFLGALVYLIVRGKGMAEREVQKVADAQQVQADYIREVAGGSAPSPAEQIEKAKLLLDSGAISQQEFDALKAKALS